MPYIPDKRCKVCKHINGGDAKLLRRIYNSKKFVKGGESLKKIQEDYYQKFDGDPVKQFSYISLVNHCKYHQTASNEQIVEARAERMEANLPKYQNVQDLILEQGEEKILSGEMKLNASNVLQAAKQKQDYETKQQDRKDAFMKMLWGYASGELAIKDRRMLEHTDTVSDGGTEGA